MTRPLRLAASLAAAALLAACAGGGNEPASTAQTNDWPSYNGDLQSRRFSSLTELTPQNVAQLKPVCSAKLPESGSFQSGPLEIGGVLYVTTATKTYAIDAATCAMRWTNVYAPKGPRPFPVNRGVAYDGGKLFRGQIDGHLTAIDAATGKTLWDVAPASGAKGEFLSAAPIVWNGNVYIGVAGSDWGVKGRMMAFDESDGKIVWTFTTVATGSDPGAKTWQNVKSTETGGGGTWTSYTLDPATGELFVPVGNPAPDFAAGYRPGANLYTDSVVVLDAKSGALKWYYQSVPNDSHDWDMSAAPALYTTPAGASMFAVAGKDGVIRGVDRTTHKAVFTTPGVPTKNGTTRPTIAGITICPGVLGGSEWNGPAFDGKDHLLITPMDDWCAILKLGAVRYTTGQFFFGGAYSPIPNTTAHGTLTATDAATGKIVWQYKSNSPMLAGVTPTATGITLTGDMKGDLLAFDSATGKVLWKAPTQGSIAGGVITYAVNGKQYVAATSGNISRLTWGAQGVPTVVVYAR